MNSNIPINKNNHNSNRSSSSSIRGFRPRVPSIDPKTPLCRLSRPGNQSVRVIPPLRGLDKVYCCSWCSVGLFCLANVIRVDIDSRTLVEAALKAEDKDGVRGYQKDSIGEVGLSSYRMNVEGSYMSMGPPTPGTTPKASKHAALGISCLLYTSPSPRDRTRSRMPSSA